MTLQNVHMDAVQKGHLNILHIDIIILCVCASPRSFTIQKENANSTIGVVLYSRSFYVSKVDEDNWPKGAVERGLQAASTASYLTPILIS